MERKTTLCTNDKPVSRHSASILKQAIIVFFVLSSSIAASAVPGTSQFACSTANNAEVPESTPNSITGSGTPLPIGFISFTATSNGDDNHLMWKTATEQYLNSYTVERSDNGIYYLTIATLASQATDGNSSQVLNYTYVDYGVNATVHAPFFYRVRQTGNDGSFTYSNVVRLANRGAGGVRLAAYPNPSKGTLIMDMSTGCNSDATLNVTVTSATGTIAMNRSFPATGGHLCTTLDLSAFPAGTYYVQVRSAYTPVQVQQIVLLPH